MTRLPRPPLDAEERALVARLPRPHGRDEPGTDIDARILAAAHAAATAAAATTSRRRRWRVPAGLAASLCLALGLAWRIQLAPPDAAPAGARPVPATPAKTVTVPSESAAASPQAQPAPMAVAVPAPAPSSRSISAADAPPALEAMPSASAIATPPTETAPTSMVVSPAPPPSPPAAASAPRAMAAEAVASPPPRAATAAKARAAEADLLAQDTADDAPVADIPPATADAPEVREAWLRRIGELQRLGKTAEARASLAEFRHRYPKAVLPAALHALEVPAAEPASH